MESVSLVFTVLTALGFIGAFGSVLYKAHKSKSVKHLHIDLFGLFLIAGALLALGSIVGMWNDKTGGVSYGRKAIWIVIGLSICGPCAYLVKIWWLHKKQGKLFRGRVSHQFESFNSPSRGRDSGGEGSALSHNVNLGNIKVNI